MTYAAFMELALYDPERGFYTDPARGPGADYETSPALTPAFGSLVSRQLETMWRALYEPEKFTVLEAGGGRGDLAAAVFDSSPELPLEWIFVERSSRVRTSQERRFGKSSQVAWQSSLDDGPAVVGVVLANEVLDNFPVHLCEVSPDGVCEVLIDSREDQFIEVLRPPSSPSLAAEMQEPAGHLVIGDRFELGLGLRAWCDEASAALRQGYLLVIDYGDTSPAIWTGRPSGTLVSYRNEQLTTDVLEDPGHADITAHVNFSRLVTGTKSAGFRDATLVTQAEWLESLGLGALVSSLKDAEKQAVAEERHSDAVSLMAERGRLHLLSSTPGLGDLKVLRAAKNAPADSPVI